MQFIGIDLGTSTVRKSTGIACLVEKGGKPWIESLPVHIISDDMKIHSHIKQIAGEFGSRIIAIDAPLSKPEHGTMRECERRLRKQGIACYPSGANFVRDWVNKGICLKGWAKTQLNAEVIEVYPYAARVKLEIGSEVKKKTLKGRRVIQEGLMALIGGLDEIIKGSDNPMFDDELDAILSAYSAYCKKTGNFERIDGSDGIIYLPVKRHDHTIDEYGR